MHLFSGGKHKYFHITNKIPKEINSYHEIFLGGGSVLLAILYIKIKKLLLMAL